MASDDSLGRRVYRIGDERLGRRLYRHHIHLTAEEVGAPRTEYDDTTMSVEHVAVVARRKFALDGWHLVEDVGHDIDVTYDGFTYIVEAWVC